eukprot:360799-Pyramimonas_sp.AAC.1
MNPPRGPRGRFPAPRPRGASLAPRCAGGSGSGRTRGCRRRASASPAPPPKARRNRTITETQTKYPELFRRGRRKRGSPSKSVPARQKERTDCKWEWDPRLHYMVYLQGVAEPEAGEGGGMGAAVQGGGGDGVHGGQRRAQHHHRAEPLQPHLRFGTDGGEEG